MRTKTEATMTTVKELGVGFKCRIGFRLFFALTKYKENKILVIKEKLLKFELMKK